VSATWSSTGQQAPPPGPPDAGDTGVTVSKTGDPRQAFTGAATPNSRVAAGEQAVPVDLAQVRALLQFQQQVNRYIKGYLGLEDVRRKCLDARAFCEGGISHEDLTRLRALAWEDIRDAMHRVPPGLEGVLSPVRDGLDAIRADISDDQGPLFRAPDKAELEEFVRRIRHRLSTVIDAVADALGFCQREGLVALERLNWHVESIFAHTDNLTIGAGTTFEPRGSRVAAAPPAAWSADAVGVRTGHDPSAMPNAGFRMSADPDRVLAEGGSS
jgi:hypothetical protein